MSTRKKDLDLYLEALRCDLPSTQDEVRVRARLLATGVLISTDVVTPSASAAATGASHSGLLAKLAAWPVAAKVGLASGAMAATATPIAWYASETRPEANAPVRTAQPPPGPEQARSAVGVRSPGFGASARPRVVTETERTSHDHTPAAEPEASPRTNGAVGPASVPHAAAQSGTGEPRTPAPTQVAGSLQGVTPQAAIDGFSLIEAKPNEHSMLAEETRLMERAMTALRAGNREMAAQWLSEHNRRFPNGLLARERERAHERLRRAVEASESDSAVQ
jgi:hypothetical protein